jgi:hypothetical protein
MLYMMVFIYYVFEINVKAYQLKRRPAFVKEEEKHGPRENNFFNTRYPVHIFRYLRRHASAIYFFWYIDFK